MGRGLEFAPGSVLSEPRKFVLTPAPGELEDSLRLVTEKSTKYRFSWVLEYRNNTHFCQYTRNGGNVFQRLFSRVPHEGVKRIWVYDQQKPNSEPALVIPVPEEAIVRILYNCSVPLDGSAKVQRIYTFGWWIPGVHGKREFQHIDPRFIPPKWWSSKNAFL